MRIARPPDDFHIRVEPLAERTLAAASDQAPRLPEVWDGICERLKFTAHREGERLPNDGLGMLIPGSPDFGIPTIAVCYPALGDQVRTPAC